MMRFSIAPPMPTRAIASRSAVMPARVTFPAIQCHHTCGFASAGGFLNPASRSAPQPNRAPAAAARQHARTPKTRILFIRRNLVPYIGVKPNMPSRHRPDSAPSIA